MLASRFQRVGEAGRLFAAACASLLLSQLSFAEDNVSGKSTDVAETPHHSHVAQSSSLATPPLLPPCKPNQGGDGSEPSPFIGSLGAIQEYRTGKVFAVQREPIPPQEEASELFGADQQVTQAAYLLGSNTRCMLGW
jgi:hypothetical protein